MLTVNNDRLVCSTAITRLCITLIVSAGEHQKFKAQQVIQQQTQLCVVFPASKSSFTAWIAERQALPEELNLVHMFLYTAQMSIGAVAGF